VNGGDGIPGNALILVSLLSAHDDTLLCHIRENAPLLLPLDTVVHSYILPYPCLRYPFSVHIALSVLA